MMQSDSMKFENFMQVNAMKRLKYAALVVVLVHV